MQRIGNYSYLCIENLGFTGQPKLQGSGTAFPPPPLNQAMVGNPPTATAPALDGAQQSAVVPSSPWAGWFLQLFNHQRALSPSVAGQISRSVVIEAPSVDETDADWYATITTPVTIADPLVFTPGASIASSRYGRAFRAGDYVLIADDSTYVDADEVTQYRFEIAQIANISAGGSWTLNRSGTTSAKGEALFGTRIVTHTPTTKAIRIFRLIDKFWNIPLPSPAALQCLKLPWDNMCVAAVVLTVANLEPLLLHTIGSVATPPMPVPGFRTLSGAEYTLGNPDAITLGQTSVLRLTVAGWHSIRNMFFEFDGVSGSGVSTAGDTEIALVYIQPNRARAFLVATFRIQSGQRESYATPQQNLRFPVSAIDPLGWPPHTLLPEMLNALDADGKLVNGFSLDPTSLALIEEDGELDYIVTANATTPGVGLRGTVQT